MQKPSSFIVSLKRVQQPDISHSTHQIVLLDLNRTMLRNFRKRTTYRKHYRCWRHCLQDCRDRKSRRGRQHGNSAWWSHAECMMSRLRRQVEDLRRTVCGLAGRDLQSLTVTWCRCRRDGGNAADDEVLARRLPVAVPAVREDDGLVRERAVRAAVAGLPW